MKKNVTTLLVLVAIFLIAFTTTLSAKVISFAEFSAKTGLTIEDFVDDDDTVAEINAMVVDEGGTYTIYIGDKVYTVNKQ